MSKLTRFQELNMSDIQMLITAIHSIDPAWSRPLREKLDRMQENLLNHELVWVCIETEE